MYFHIIMPSSSHPGITERRQRIEAIAKDQSINVHFPHYSPGKSSFDFESTIRDLRNAEFVVADLSLERPSCYYEVGLAEALSKRVHIVAEEGTFIHQTAGRENVVFYGNITQFTDRIKEIISAEVGIREANKGTKPTP